jgi:hypothetical protein
MPAVTRQVIMRLEHHRRESVSVWELSVLAAAGDQPGAADLPARAGRGDRVPARPAGRAVRRGALVERRDRRDRPGRHGARGKRRHPAAPFGDHRQVLAEVPRELTGAAYRRAGRAQPRPGHADAGAEGMLAVVALREIRASIRDAGLQPPPLSRELAGIDDPDS